VAPHVGQHAPARGDPGCAARAAVRGEGRRGAGGAEGQRREPRPGAQLQYPAAPEAAGVGQGVLGAQDPAVPELQPDVAEIRPRLVPQAEARRGAGAPASPPPPPRPPVPAVPATPGITTSNPRGA